MRLRETIPAPGSGQPRRYYVDDVEVSREEYDRAAGRSSRKSKKKLRELFNSNGPDGHRSSCWPMAGSDALMVGAKNVAAESAKLAAMGLPTEFTSKGQPIFRDRNHRKLVTKAMTDGRGVDNDAGYGDAS